MKHAFDRFVQYLQKNYFSYWIVFVVLAIGFYAMSLGPVTWVLLSEIFPNKVRGVAMAVCTAALVALLSKKLIISR